MAYILAYHNLHWTHDTINLIASICVSLRSRLSGAVMVCVWKKKNKKKSEKYDGDIGGYDGGGNGGDVMIMII